jgi:hypothetical protein
MYVSFGVAITLDGMEISYRLIVNGELEETVSVGRSNLTPEGK